ncbi:MAG: preprotein translocase subunit SecE [Candidatus Melainabacteria bacterium]|nr:preprotein translocase subunit SecE [Candidatus Melainabacteria bacterium]
MSKTAEKEEQSKDKSGFMQWLAEDDAPEIGIASKEPAGEYFRGVKTEFKKIEWPNKEQVQNEFVTVIVIVAIISAIVYFIDIGLDNVINTIKGI